MESNFNPSFILDSPNVVCDECGSKLFKPAYVLKKVSSLVSPTGKQEIVEIPLFVCAKCGRLPKEYSDNNNAKKIFGEEIKEEKKSILEV